MKAAVFDYVRAGSAAEAAAILAADEGAKLLGGGQSLGPTLNLRLARPGRLVDLKRAEGLRSLAGDDAHLAIGAGWTHAAIEDGVVPDPARGMLAQVAHGIAYRAVRNRGTLGGSLAHADPSADWVATMFALNATMVVTGRAGTRRVAAEGFTLGAFATALAEDEVLVAVEVPRLSAGARWGYAKLCRKTGEFAKAIGAAVLDPARGLARVVAGATGGAPVLLPAASAALREQGWQAAAAGVAGEIGSVLPNSDAAARAQHAAMLRRALAQLDLTR
ncbi:FAD binding domain-containing protein [Roseomonas sp. NAR14]|uniref:FAD binding domain-containing protein n=1 Tax=Roseomonas acroporae TaxID=2937791 RepID=A0A9X2BXZ8_9PROT|nr:FAD binding domain-containing protein [Roseomonas acroporae]MCK8787826.1 FAD binding domain-containing protein [Roseomonas acroporae]